MNNQMDECVDGWKMYCCVNDLLNGQISSQMYGGRNDQMDGQMDRWTVKKMVHRFNDNKKVLVGD